MNWLALLILTVHWVLCITDLRFPNLYLILKRGMFVHISRVESLAIQLADAQRRRLSPAGYHI